MALRKIPIIHSIASHAGETLFLAIPVALGQIGHILIGMTDTKMIGALGKTELSAAALGNSLFFLLGSLGFGVSAGVAPVVAQARGRGDRIALAGLLPQALWVSMGVSFILVIGLAIVNIMLPYMGQADPEVVPITQSFLAIITASLPPMIIFLALRSYADAFGNTIVGMVIMYVMVGLNVFLNWLLIYGHWGFPELGVNGSAWATLIARVSGVGMIIGYILFAPRFRPYVKQAKTVLWDLARAKEILFIGLPTALQVFFESFAFSIALVILGWMGSVEQSAHQIAIMLAAFTYMIYLGISTAASIRTGNAYGRGDWREARLAGFSALALGGVFILMSFVFLLAGHKLLPGFFIREEETEVIRMASSLLLIAAFFQFFDGIQAVMQGALRGVSDVRLPTIISLLAYLVVGLPVGWYLGWHRGGGAEGMWYGLTLGLFFAALFLTIRFWRLTRNSVRRDAPNETKV